MALEVTWEMAALFLFASGLATYIRIKDSPALVLIVDKKVDWSAMATLAETFFVSILAALLSGWALALEGVYIDSIAGFGTITLAAVAGMSTVRAILNHLPAAPA